MKVFLFIALYTLANVYIYSKIKRCLLSNVKSKLVYFFVYVIYGTLLCSPIFNFIFKSTSFEKITHAVSFYYIGILVITLFVFVIIDIIRFLVLHILKKDKNIFESKKYKYSSLVICLVTIISYMTYGTIHYSKIYINTYSVDIAKETNIDNLKIALVADFHLGFTIGYEMIEDMVSKINAENPDIVLIAGDIFDNTAYAVDDITKCEDALKSLKSTYGTYAIFGNHDVKEKLLFGFSLSDIKEDYRDEKMVEMLNNASITILDDKVTLINDSFYLVGRKDYSKPGFGSRKRETLDNLAKDVDFSKPVIILEHQPKQLEIANSIGADLHLAGHTHAGQFFPLNIGINFLYKNAYGIKNIGNMTSIVTSGVGLYGPPIRVGTDSEIAIINVNFKK